MKTSFLILIIIFLNLSCGKIQPEKINQKKQNFQNHINENESFSCGIISCNLKNHLIELKNKNQLTLPDLGYFQSRFGTLISRYKNFNELIQSSDFKKYSHDLNFDFFNCSGIISECSTKEKKYDENTLNYLFYIFIPNMVIDEYKKIGITDMENIENIIQAIKQNDFTIDEIRVSLINQHINKIKEKYQNNSFQYIQKEKLKSSGEYFEEIIYATNTGLLYNIFKDMLDINLIWISEAEMEILYKNTSIVFFETLKQLEIQEKDFYKQVDNSHIEKKLKEKIELFSKKYNLITKLPNDRLYRNDELYIFNKNNISHFEKQAFGNNTFYLELKEIINLSYLLSLTNNKQNLFFFPNIVKQLKFENSFIYINLSEYIEKISIDIIN